MMRERSPSQDPESGKEVEEGTTIGVVISNGKGSVEVPSVTGDSEDDAVSALEKEGFKPNKTYAYDDSVEEGKVISQTPSAGDKAKTGDTITIVISQGAEAVTVPDVKTTYKSEEQARDLLSDFNVTVKTAYSDRPGRHCHGSEHRSGQAGGKRQRHHDHGKHGTVTVPECDSDDLQLQGDDQSAGRYVQRIRRNNHVV